jgi:F420-dependent oxidoreductase-like protein
VIRLPDPCVVVLVGVAGSGKSTWASTHFAPEQVVSSDALRAVVGTHEHDQRASKDSFEVLELIVERRAARGLATIIDSTALEDERRARYREIAAKARLPCIAVVFDVDDKECRARNRSRPRPVPDGVLRSQLASMAEVIALLPAEGFAAVHAAAPAVLVPPVLLDAPAAAGRQLTDPVPLELGLHVGRFGTGGHPEQLARRLRDVAIAAEESGFTSLWVMDHVVQVPQVGREWDDMLEGYTTLGYLAGATSAIRLGVLVSAITFRNLAHLAKTVATLDVLSDGRAMCGLGIGWYEREHQLYGWDFPPVARRYEMLEDALELLPLMWGKGSPRFEGRTITIPEAICYPRPLQERIPIVVGGSGERRTLRLAARHADAVNLFGNPDMVRHRIDVLHQHCETEGRDPSTITVTHFGVALDASAEDHIGRYRELAEAGVQAAFVALPGDLDPDAVRTWAPVINVFGRERG